MHNIEFSMENISRCLCTVCDVQKNSDCVKDKQKLMFLIKNQDLDSPMMMGPDRVPGVYCSTGKAVCEDINTHEICKCNECPVWKEYSLDKFDNNRYFCEKGQFKP